MRPSILSSIYVEMTPENQWGVFTSAPLTKGTVVEICSWIPVTQRTFLLLQKARAPLISNMLPNLDAADKEREIIGKIADLELQRRLDQGTVTPLQVKQLMMELVKPEQMLEMETYAIPTGYGSVYRKSDRPNLSWEYDRSSKLYKFFVVEEVRQNRELTLDNANTGIFI